jgi:hypothetical protein
MYLEAPLRIIELGVRPFDDEELVTKGPVETLDGLIFYFKQFVG